MDTLKELKEALERNDIVFATRLLEAWHPITLSNLLLAVQAARTMQSPTKQWTMYKNAVLALAWHELKLTSLDSRYPESALSVIEMAVDFNRDSG